MKLIELKKIAKQTNYRIKRAECELTLFNMEDFELVEVEDE